jgi:hypothetical protein
MPRHDQIHATLGRVRRGVGSGIQGHGASLTKCPSVPSGQGALACQGQGHVRAGPATRGNRGQSGGNGGAVPRWPSWAP